MAPFDKLYYTEHPSTVESRDVIPHTSEASTGDESWEEGHHGVGKLRYNVEPLQNVNAPLNASFISDWISDYVANSV